MKRLLRLVEVASAIVALVICAACGVRPSPPKVPAASQSPAGNPDSRTRWINASYFSKIEHVQDKEWKETDDKTGQTRWQLTETGRTPDYIELFNAERNQQWRIFSDR